jgi:glycine/D-amino acid oxidase-like deaminating enzyme
VIEQLRVVVVGAGQAGLAVSCELTHAGVDHVVLERGRVGQTWRGRWDSFCVVTPNWTVQLPGHPYDRQEPNGFMPRSGRRLPRALCRRLLGAGPRRSGSHLGGASPWRGFQLDTSAGQIAAGRVVLSTGAYQQPHRPRVEKIYRQSWPTRAEARAALFAYIEAWYNPRRRHSALEYLSPAEFERQHAGVVQSPLDRSISGAPNASDALTTRRISTVALDYAADRPISPENALIAQPGGAEAATDRCEGTNSRQLA